MTLTWASLAPSEKDNLEQTVAGLLLTHDSSRISCADHDGECCPATACQHGMNAKADRVHVAEFVIREVMRMLVLFEHGRAGAPARDIEPTPESVTLPDGAAVNAMLYAMRNCGDHVETVGTALIVDPQETVASLLTRLYGLDSPNPYGYLNDPRDSRVELRLAVTEWPLPRQVEQQPTDVTEGPF